ncbi:MAG: methyltransferase domain-containing protein [Anaerolineaceae bacterium]
MRLQTRQKLQEINCLFYEHSAATFSATRKKLQPGVNRLLKTIPLQAKLLDLGCGNGNLAGALARTAYSGTYLGVDASEALISYARAALSGAQADFSFLVVDLTDEHWFSQFPSQAFQVITCFAALHHIPDASQRAAFFQAAAGLLAPEGRLLLSVWQLFNDPRMRSHVLPWSNVAIDAEDLEPGEYLIDWRAGGQIDQRYVHVFSPEELRALGCSAGLELEDEFYSDGKSRNLALYQVWRKPA